MKKTLALSIAFLMVTVRARYTPTTAPATAVTIAPNLSPAPIIATPPTVSPRNTIARERLSAA